MRAATPIWVFRYRYGSASDAVRELASWDIQDVRRALELVGNLLGSSVTIEPLIELAAPETKHYAAEDRALYGAEVSHVLYLRSAAGLHTAVARFKLEI